MTLEKAIQLLNELGTDAIEQLDPVFQDAIQLGIEAIKRVHAIRALPGTLGWTTLPGETKEN